MERIDQADMEPTDQGSLAFGPFRISRSERLLRRGDEVVPLAPKAVDTLIALAESQGRVLDKAVLMEKVWPDTFIEEGGLARNISMIRKTLGTDDAGNDYIETIPRRGYRFVAPVSKAQAEGAGVGSLAVLPLLNLSAAPMHEYFADGMTDALISTLMRIESLRVASRTSVMRYKGANKGLREVARELDVDRVLEGSVLLAGDRVRVAASLVRGDNEKHLWAGSYERDLSDVIALQSDLARTIAREVRVKLSEPERAMLTRVRVVNPEAYHEFLRGRFFWNQRTRESLCLAMECFRKAITFDPGDAPSHAGLAETYALLGSVGYDGMPPHAAMPAAREAALEALRLDPQLAEAHTALAIVKLLYDWDWEGAENELLVALEINPACLAAYQWRGELEMARARPEEAAAAFVRGIKLDPYSISCNMGLGWAYYFSRRFDQATLQFERTLEMAPHLPMALYGLGLTLHHNRQQEKAQQMLRQAENSSGGEPASITLLAITALLSGNAEGASIQLERLRAMTPHTYVPPVYFAFIHAMRNELDDAFNWLERAFDERSSYLIFLRLQPALHNLRADPRFFQLVRRIGQ